MRFIWEMRATGLSRGLLTLTLFKRDFHIHLSTGIEKRDERRGRGRGRGGGAMIWIGLIRGKSL